MKTPEWTSEGKSVAQLIRELRTFENQEMEVRISVDNGVTSLPISLVGKASGKFALLMNSQMNPPQSVMKMTFNQMLQQTADNGR